jgi:hypothetical protein
VAVYREGSGAWKPVPAPNSKGRSVLPVSDDYEIATVDMYPGGSVFTTITASTVAETKPIDACPEMQQTTVDVTAQLNGSGMAWLDGFGFTPDSTGKLDMMVNPGTHDLVATSAYPSPDGSGRFVIQRGMTITGAMDVGTIDLTNGVPFTPVPLTVTGGSGTPTLDVSLETDINDYAYVSSTSAMSSALVVPQSQLKSTDKQWIYVWSGDSSAQAKFTGNQTTFALPPALTGITFSPSGTSASWTTLPSDYSGAYMFAFDTTVATAFEIDATKGWLDAHPTTSFAAPTDIPGFQAGWAVMSSSVTSMTVWRDDGDFTYFSSAEPPTMTPAHAPSPRMRTRLGMMR